MQITFKNQQTEVERAALESCKKEELQHNKMFCSFKSYLRDEQGQGISEYLIILAVVVIAAIALATTFSDQLSALWGSITSQLQAIS